MSLTPRVSIVVPTRNSARTIAACLASCAAQTVPVELIVVDRNSTDGTPDIARRYAGTVANFGPERSAQRNEGARLAKGEFVVIIDGDMVLSPRVIEACLQALAAPGTVGAVIPEESFGEGFWAECKALERSFYLGVTWMEAARFFRRSDYLAVGGYDERLVSGEDWDLSQRLARRGALARIDQLIFHDEGRLTLRGLLRKKAYYGREFARYARKTEHRQAVDQQTGIFARYALFLSKPVKLFRRPFVGLGMLFLKACEFAAGAYGYFSAGTSTV